MPVLSECEISENILKQLTNGENYIFAAGRLGEEILSTLLKHNISVTAFIDNYSKKSVVNDIPVIKLDSLSNKNTNNIIIASINYMYDMELQVKNSGFKNVISFGTLTRVFPELQIFNQAFDGLWNDYENNKDKYDELYKLLDDEKSKSVLDTIVEYRRTSDISLYDKIQEKFSIQYFEDFVPQIPVFVDGGAYDGINSIDFISRNSEYEHIYVFEPDAISMSKAKQVLSDYKNIEFLNYGISDSQKVLKFYSSHDSGALISDGGDTELQCIALDDVIKYDKAYIKLDIEGAEMDAINGAKRLISNGSPLAVCVYHKPQDIWALPLRLKELNPNYKFKLRHYTSTIFETVLYAII